MTSERKTCPVTRDRLHPGVLVTGCSGEVLEKTATKCPICGKPIEMDPFQRLKDEHAALKASHTYLKRYCNELATEVYLLRDFREAVENRDGALRVVPEATMKRIEKTLVRRKREVQTLQEKCRQRRAQVKWLMGLLDNYEQKATRVYKAEIEARRLKWELERAYDAGGRLLDKNLALAAENDKLRGKVKARGKEIHRLSEKLARRRNEAKELRQELAAVRFSEQFWAALAQARVCRINEESEDELS